MASLTASVLGDVIFAAPSLNAQLINVLLHSILWALLVRVILPPIFAGYLRKMSCKTQFLKLAREFFKANFFYDMGEDEEGQIEWTAQFQGIVLQHGLGGLLCMPSALGLGGYLPAGLASMMARHGGLCEVGWELQDTIARVLELIFEGERGREKNPPALLLVLALHHTCAVCLVLPLNIYYPEDTHYHEGIMLLQLAAFIALSAQQYGWTLNVKNQKGLDDMRLSVTLSWVAIVWSRVLRYGFVWKALFLKFTNESDPFLLNIAFAPVVSMTLFNVPVVLDATAKLIKFYRMTIKEEEEGETQSATLLAQLSGGQRLQTLKQA